MSTQRNGRSKSPVGRGTRKDRLLRAKMKKKQQEEDENSPNGASTTFEDILQMSDLSEASLLDNLHRRYDKDLVYTYVGPILIAINPYKKMDYVYCEKNMTLYFGKSMGSLPPHVFALADHAYQQLIQGGAVDPYNQSIIISGESGAGKTETTKIIMQYLARATSYRKAADDIDISKSMGNPLSPKNSSVSRALGKLEERVLESNPLLESFGNAKTSRNDNSSRFGKFIEIQFDHHGKIVGAEIMNFLLEKTRIVSQSLDERNYHIFYQLLAGADDALREKLRLTGPEDYEYLRNSQCFEISSVDDGDEFLVTKNCMSIIGIPRERQERVFDLLAVILHLGNLEFEIFQEECVPSGEASTELLSLIADLLEVSVDALNTALLTRQLYVGGKVIVQQQNVDQVRDKRDSLAKAIYASLFLWLVTELNRTISRPDEKWGFIGVLDIYGFEKFDWNTFEQLCINYANEKLQRHFNQHMLEVEQEEYTKEGIDWTHIDFVDNQQCLDLIEGKTMGKPGIFITLDDIWRLKGEEANKKFVSILHAAFGKTTQSATTTQNEWYIHPKVDSNLHFGIKHYAGDVIYDASGFNDKNNETLNDDMKDLVAQSKSSWIQHIFSLNVQSLEAAGPANSKRPAEPGALSRRPSDRSATAAGFGNGAAGGGGKSRNLREVSVGAQFRFQLQELMAKISIANPRYVRCIKPNEMKSPGLLNDEDCARQLKYSGMMEAIQIRQRGFALREDHDVFFYDYQTLAPDAETVEELIEEISTMLGAGKDQWQLGKNKVFLKRAMSLKLRKLEMLRCKSAARRLQRWVRHLKLSEHAITIQTKFRQFRAKKELRTLRRAAYMIMNQLRTRVATSKYKLLVIEYRLKTKTAIVIQKYARGYLVRRLHLLKPFEGMGPKELDEKIAAMELSIAQAANDKQFELCSELQKDLEKLVEARKKVRTAKEIDTAIEKLNQEMEEAAKAKKFALCTELQKQLEELREVRTTIKEDLNELEPHELDDRIKKMEDSISEAMKSRNFELCGQLQTELDTLNAARKKKKTPEELDAEIDVLNLKISEHMEHKQFDKCAEVQREIDELKRRRSKFKTPAKPKPKPARPIPQTTLQASNSTPQLQSQLKASKSLTPTVVQPVEQASQIPAAVATSNTIKKVGVSAPTNSPAVVKKNTPTPSVNVSAARNKAPTIGGRPRAGSNSSIVSAQSYARSTVSKTSTVMKRVNPSADPSRTVARLRPAKPLIVVEDVTIREAAKLMKTRRTSALAVADTGGALVGILTDTDTARRVIAKSLDPDEITVGDVMTPQPSCVTMDDAAVDALDIMLKGKFRHLPVVSNENGSVVGLLSVAKCLHDAIRRIEKSSTSLEQEISGSDSSTAIVRTMLQKMLSPSLKDVLTSSGEPMAPLVNAEDVIFDVTQQIAQTKKPALVVEDGRLIGIFTPKDLLHRVIAADIDLYTTTVGEVMTHHPESVGPDTTVLDAFHIMHDGNFLNLPVVDPEIGEILGCADVISISCASFGQGESKDIGRLMNAAFDLQHQDHDDVSSVSNMSISNMSVTSKVRQRLDRDKTEKVSTRPVSSLRPSAAITIDESSSILEATALMKQKRSDALLVVDESSALVGIITDTDICRRVVALDVDPASTHVSDIMTKNIKFVAPEDSAIDALLSMQEGHFRHLPVVDRDNSIAGVLNIGKCIYDVSKRLEHAISSAEQLKASLEKSASSTVQQLLGPMMSKLLAPTLASLLENDKQNGISVPRVPKGTLVSEVAKAIASTRKAALVVDNEDPDRLCGVFSPNELVMKVIAMSLDPGSTYVEDVMQSDPDIATPTTSVLEGLHIMHDSQCLNIPVVEDGSSDEVVGLVDILSLSYGTIDAIYGADREKMQEFWNTVLQLEHPNNPADLVSSTNAPRSRTTLQSLSSNRQDSSRRMIPKQTEVSRTVAQLRPSKVLTVEENTTILDLCRQMSRSHSDCTLVVSDDGVLVGIVTDTDLTRRVVSANLPLDSTFVGDIMTANPLFVSADDQAIDALCRMLEGKFRHLPVVDKGGMIVGILNIGKCLYDAIKKMEKAEKASAALRESLDRGPNLASLLGPMVDKIFSPTIKSVLDNETSESPRVQPYTSVYEVSKKMAAAKKAALVVSNKGQYFGMFTPKNMLENVLAKGLPVHTTPVCEVMHEDAPTVFGSTRVIDAMHSMHENKTLYLAVMQSEASLQALGLVDVLSLSYGSFAKGNPSDWQAFWNASFGTTEDEDDVSSVHSFRSSVSASTHRRANDQRLRPSMTTGDSRPVSKLRPSKAVTILEHVTVAEAAKQMGVHKTDAALVISSDGMLKGILTDTDVTRRVVALGNDPEVIPVYDAMTPNPKFVDERDSAMDAMFTMLEGKFRHLPVVDSQGLVAGMLRIQKCLYDAITRLETAQTSSNGVLRQNLEKQLLASGVGASLLGSGGSLQHLVGPMIEKMLSPTLETILKIDKMPPIVYADDVVVEVARQMAGTRKAALVVEDDPSIRSVNRLTTGKRLIGVFTPKDLLLRVVGKSLDPFTCTMQDVMTPNPETAERTTTLTEALHVMHEQHFLHLPVVDETSGAIVGMVDVLSLCYGSSGSDTSDWKNFWDMALAVAKDDDDQSEVGSTTSWARKSLHMTSRASLRSVPVRKGRSRSRGSSAASQTRKEADGVMRPVSKLRPRQVTRIDEFITVAEAAKRMRHARVEAVVITTDEGELRGIFTDTDITRRVLAKGIDPETCSVASVMTCNPSCVCTEDPALEAITKMLEGRFKHLPVVGTDGIISGMLDISKCLYDAISCMEKAQQSTEAAASDISRDLGSLHRLLGPMMEKMVRPTVADALEGEVRPPIVTLDAMCGEVVKMMATTKKAAIVVDASEKVVGMLTPKDLLRKLVAKGLDVETTAVEEVMTSDPEFVGPSARILDGLRLMSDAGQLFMPVLSDIGDVVGMADVLCLSYGQFSKSSTGSAGGNDWRQFWQTAMNLQEEAGSLYDDETNSVGTIEDFERSELRAGQLSSLPEPTAAMSVTGRSGYHGTSLYSELGDSVSVASAAHTTATSAMFKQTSEDTFVFKVSDRTQGVYHRILCGYRDIGVLLDQVRTKTNADADDEIRLKYEDDDGDLAALTTDESLMEAVGMAKRAGWKRIVLLVDIIKSSNSKAGSTSVATSSLSVKPNRSRKLTKVEEEMVSENEEATEDQEVEETIPVKKLKKTQHSQEIAADIDPMLIGGAVAGVVLVLGLGILLLRRKN